MRKAQTGKAGFFNRFAKAAARATGQPLAFIIAVLIIVLWGLAGPFFSFGTSWQLFINSWTTIVTFLMVFLIQNTQNRDTEAMQIKLDEIIRATIGAHNVLLDLEEMSEAELDAIRNRYEQLAERARKELRKGRPDTGTPPA